MCSGATLPPTLAIQCRLDDDHASFIDDDLDGEGLMDLESGSAYLRYLQPGLAGIGVKAWGNTREFRPVSTEMVRAEYK